ncbi:hypothetical protein ACTG9Q_20045 [Actinokineospora sp. 24-640]
MQPMLRQFPRWVARITSALEHGRPGVTVRLFACSPTSGSGGT